MAKRKTTTSSPPEPYRHKKADNPMRPEVGVQPQFTANKKNSRPTQRYRYDSSLAPALDYDGQNPAREEGEALIRQIMEATTLEGAKAAAARLKAMSRPFLNWAGKAERLSFDVPTLPLFVHERLSTQAIIETLRGHRRPQQPTLFDDFFADPKHDIADQVLKAYEHRDKWVNRMVLGDSLVVMNSLLHYEKLGGQVQMIYMDPPYGVKFGSNFQPFVRKRDVKHNDDDDLTREPEMVQAYRDTWELGLHSYLTYMRDRLLVARELLHPSGSIFVQISDENLHHVRELMDEVFGGENCVAVITFRKTTSASSELLPIVNDYLLWYARDHTRVKYRPVYSAKSLETDISGVYRYVRLRNGTERRLTNEELNNPDALPPGSKIYRLDTLTSQRPPGDFPVDFEGGTYRPGRGYWKTGVEGMQQLIAAHRVAKSGSSLAYKRFIDDFPAQLIGNLWTDTQTGSFTEPKTYVVQTSVKVPQRCLLMTTDPGDLVLDPTCGSGTTAYVAEQWGRRWITTDVSRVPLALARQRLLTATFPWYQLKDDEFGPAGGFVYKRRQNAKGEEVGGIVPHVTLKSIANNEPPAEEVLVDRPEKLDKVTRVTGPFVVEGTIPTPVEMESSRVAPSSPVAPRPEERVAERRDYANYPQRMLEVLRKSPVLRLEGNKTITFANVRPPTKTLSLSAEAVVPNGEPKTVAFVFGPENGAVSEALVYAAAREAFAKGYTHLYVIGFAIEAPARKLVDQCESVVGIPATYVQATLDLLMGDLLKNMRSSQVFSVCGLPEVEVKRVKANGKKDVPQYQVKLVGLDVFDPTTLNTVHRKGDDVPAWLLDTDYNERCFRVAQAFFPRTSAWDNLKKALKGEYKESVWDHLAGTTSAPFEAGDQKRIAVKVIDDRGNELLVVKAL
jgi:adenine-specific DNA-methyltransferase